MGDKNFLTIKAAIDEDSNRQTDAWRVAENISKLNNDTYELVISLMHGFQEMKRSRTRLKMYRANLISDEYGLVTSIRYSPDY